MATGSGDWRLFEILDELRLPATVLLDSSVCYTYPDIVEKIRQRGDDVIGHGRTNAELLNSCRRMTRRASSGNAREVLEKNVIGVRPTAGWGRAPTS